jgi:hypothetical protein
MILSSLIGDFVYGLGPLFPIPPAVFRLSFSLPLGETHAPAAVRE